MTCFVATQSKRWSCSLILTTMHLYTPNYLLSCCRFDVVTLTCTRTSWDANASYDGDQQLLGKSAAALLFLLLTSKPRTPISVLNVLLGAAEKTHRWTHKTQVSSRCFWAKLSTSPAADSMWYVDWRCCASAKTSFTQILNMELNIRLWIWWGCDHRIALWRGVLFVARHIWNRMQLTCRKSLHGSVGISTKWTITRHTACVSY